MPYLSKVLLFPFAAVDLVHADGAPCSREISASAASRFAEQQIARLLGGALIDADAAPPHLQHHRHQVDVEPVGVAQSLAVEDRLERLEQLRASVRVGLGVGADKSRRQLPDVRSGRLIFLRLDAKPAASIASSQQRLVLAGQAVALADRVEAV